MQPSISCSLPAMTAVNTSLDSADFRFRLSPSDVIKHTSSLQLCTDCRKAVTFMFGFSFISDSPFLIFWEFSILVNHEFNISEISCKFYQKLALVIKKQPTIKNWTEKQKQKLIYDNACLRFFVMMQLTN